MRKIITKKRNVKKKVVAKKKKSKRVVKIVFSKVRKTSALQSARWGEKFEAMAHREPLAFNKLKGIFTESPKVAGDPFSVVDFLREGQMRVNERQGHLMDALRYSQIGLKSNVRGDYAMVGNEERPDPALRKGDVPPAHYAHGKYTPWEIVDDWKLEYYTGNAMKYVCRHKHKGNPVQDIQKAIDCLVKYKSNLEKETSK